MLDSMAEGEKGGLLLFRDQACCRGSCVVDCGLILCEDAGSRADLTCDEIEHLLERHLSRNCSCLSTTSSGGGGGGGGGGSWV